MPVNKKGKFYSIHKSWIKVPTNLTKTEIIYLASLENIWKVKSGNDWVPYRMAPHQIIWHLEDVVLKKEHAKIRVEKKSRNVSFTTDSIISILMSIGDYLNDVIPFVRLNMKKAEDMIKNTKDLIRHMKPIIHEVEDNGKLKKVYWPFNPANVDMSAVGSIKFKDDYGNVLTEIRAFPANADASETIRGIRTIGDSGILDETNFMRSFKAIFTALRDSSVGTINGKKIHQFSLGTTLKGDTPFSEWLEEQEQKKSNRLLIFDFPVFDRTKFNTEIPFHENKELIPLVPWHDKEELWNDYLQDEHVFNEEYMAIKVDNEEQFYSTSLILSCCNIEEPTSITQFKTLADKYKYVWGGVDVASVHDYFVISLFGETNEGKYVQFYLEYINKIELDDMSDKVELVLDEVKNIMGDNWLTSIDANGIGLQITQTLKKKFPGRIRGISGGSIKDLDGNSHHINRFGHTEMKNLMVKKQVDLINDELLIKHYSQFDYTYSAASSKYGHGDITMANLYALLPLNLKRTSKSQVVSNIENTEKDDSDINFMNLPLKQRIMFYKQK